MEKAMKTIQKKTKILHWLTTRLSPSLYSLGGGFRCRSKSYLRTNRSRKSK